MDAHMQVSYGAQIMCTLRMQTRTDGAEGPGYDEATRFQYISVTRAPPHNVASLWSPSR